MNISKLIQGFSSYLESLNKLSEKGYNTNSSSVSIFMYSSEFKSYLSNELNIADTSIFSKNINDVLSMDIVNGQLVDSSEDNSDSFNLSTNEDQNGKNTVAITSEEENNTTQLQESVVRPKGESQIENSVLETAEDTENIDTNNQVIKDILNNLFQDQAVISILDSDGSGSLDKNEISTFLNDINATDGDILNISIDDVLAGIEQIKQKADSTTSVEESDVEDSEAEDVDLDQNVQSSSSTPSASSGNISSDSTGRRTTSSSSNSDDVQEKSLDSMTREELNSELTTAESDLADKQDILSSLLNGSEENIQAMTADMENLYDIYLSELKTVDEGMAKQVDSLKQSIDAQENIINAKDQEIANQESIVTESETAYNNAVSTKAQLESSLSSLESTDTTNMDDSQIAELNEKISELKTKIASAEQAVKDAKQAWDAALSALDSLNKERESMQIELDNLNTQMTNLEEQILEAYPQVQASLNEYKQVKELRDSYKTEATSEIKSEITTAQNYVNEINTAINNLDSKETSEEYRVSTLPITDEELAEYGFDTEEKREAWSHLVPEMKEAIVKLTDYAHSIGIEITYNSKISIFRTYEEQQELYRTSRPGYAAKPGNSRHESGEAVDITIPNADKNNPNDKSYRALAEYWMDMGYTWGGNWNACEPWHFDLRPNK